jgi:DeoR-like helix-turn-helix domain
MPAQRKNLEELLRDRSFLARRHAELLLIEPVGEDPLLRRVQERYRAEPSDLERRRLALALEKALRDPAAMVQLAQDLDAPPKEIVVLEDRAARANSDRIDEILAMGPTKINPERGRRESARFSRCLQAEWRRLDGMPIVKIAEAIGVSPATVRRDLAYLARWRAARRPPQPPS